MEREEKELYNKIHVLFVLKGRNDVRRACRIGMTGSVKKCENIKKKNIMYIFNDSGIGGAAMSLLDTLKEIKKYINPIIIIPNSANEEVDIRFKGLCISVYKIHFSTDYVKVGNVTAEKKLQDFKQSYKAALQLIPIIEKENIDLIHINSSVSYFAAIVALMTHIPYIWHIRELMEEQFDCEFINKNLKISLLKRADRLIAISDYVKKTYYDKYDLEAIRLYNGLDINKFKQDILLKNNYENNFLVAAAITPQKGQINVIEAAEILIKKGYDIHIDIVGNGFAGYVWALEKYIKRKGLENHINIIPFQNDLSSLRGIASYAITSSQNEALGRVTIEAMLAGNIVIGARSGGTTEIIGKNEERGFLYELGNIKSLSDTMEKAIKCDNEKKKAFLQEAQKYAEETFSSEKYCIELLKIYDEVISLFEPNECDIFLEKLKEHYYSIKDLDNTDLKNNIIPYKKLALMYPVVLKWLKIRQKGHSLSEYFISNNIQTIAIYGMGELGCRLYDELEDSSVRIKYLIDRNPNGMDKIFEFIRLDEGKLDVDAVIVTVVSEEKQIINEIEAYGYKSVIGLSKIINRSDINVIT